MSASLEHTLDVRRALAKLRQGDRQLLWLAYVEGLRSEDLGAMLDIRSDTARQRLSRAARRLRDELGADYPLADHETLANTANTAQRPREPGSIYL